MPRKPNPELIDDETPEATAQWFQRARPAQEGMRSANDILAPIKASC